MSSTLDTMNGQLAEMRRSDRLTQDLIASARVQADTAKREATISKSVLELAVKTFHAEQRAWVGVTHIESPRVTAGRDAVFEVTVRNVGKTPARVIKNSIVARIQLATAPLQTMYSPPTDRRTGSTVVLEPGMRVIVATPPIRRIPVPVVGALKSGKATLYVYGQFRYEDVFGSMHYTDYCFKAAKDLNSFSACKEYNEAN